MPYVALYRQWRPLTFDDVVEQQHIVRSLKHSVSTRRVAHAYLFCGTRGTGKTTMAQILSRAVNCLDPHDGNPCNKCDICKGILSGSLLDVIEIDAASNNSVDNIRDIRDEVIYTPARAKYKVYIIDEVHMLSAGAFNALLKTLEEPPSHIIFILATTEPYRLPATILSRCQRYDFRRITLDSIVARLVKVSKANKIEGNTDALKLIARLADGALRDALSILDQCISLGAKRITYDDVLSVAGIVNESFVSLFADSIKEGNIGNLLAMIDDLIMEGKDIAQFVSSLILYYRNLLLCKLLDNPENIIESSEDAVLIMKSQASLLKKENIIYIIKELSDLESGLKWVNHPRIMLEVVLIKICTEIGPSVEVSETYNTLKSPSVQKETASDASTTDTHAGMDMGTGKGTGINVGTDAGVSIDKNNEKDVTHAPGHVNRTVDENNIDDKNDSNITSKKRDEMNLQPVWDDVLKELMKSGKGPLCFILKTAKIFKIGERGISIVLPGDYKASKDIVSQSNNIKLIEELFQARLGIEVRVKCFLEKEYKPEIPLDDSNYKSEDFSEDCSQDCIEKISDFALKLNAPFNIFDK